MAEPPPLQKLRCSLLLFVATPAEMSGVLEAADECKIKPVRVKEKQSRLGVEYYDLGAIGNEVGVIALPPSRDDDKKLVMGSIGYFGTAARAMRIRGATGAQGIVQVGMAFGINPAKQKAGDVLVSTSLIPYDNRDIKPRSTDCPVCKLRREDFVAEYQQVTRERARPSLIGLFERERARGHKFNVELGAMLSGAARLHCGLYRDELVRGMPQGPDLIVGGEMEGFGLLTASQAWNDPVWCVVKGISDFADENRDAVIAENRPIACRNAAFFVLSALMNDASPMPVGGANNAN